MDPFNAYSIKLSMPLFSHSERAGMRLDQETSKQNELIDNIHTGLDDLLEGAKVSQGVMGRGAGSTAKKISSQIHHSALADDQ